MANNKYREYFDIDEAYFPCIDDSAINAGAPWDNTYPHETFIDLLKKTEYMLGGSTKRSLWIHGAYGTGKSQCALAIRKILEASEDELQDYWNKYEPLQKHNDILQKLLGHKSRGIVTAHRYASGGISTPREFFFAIQESVKVALISSNAKYLGENTLKENAIAWIKENKFIINELLKKPKWSATFSQSTADEVLSALQRSVDVRNLMNNLFRLAEDGITAFSLDAESLKIWIRDVIKQNNIKIVFVWDEFSGYFKNNNSLDEFQNIVSLCQEVPFYLIVVTHQTDYVMSNQDQSWKVVRQRFEFTEITLPDNIAFELIGHAFNVKQSAKDSWSVLADDLNGRLNDSREAVMKIAKIDDPQIMKNIMPLHPIAALILKTIASAFSANQRSMFDFIKSSNMEDVKAFQWFIESTGPEDDHPLLTVDMLWNFFYENGKDNLPSDIRLILDTFPQQQNLREEEKTVFKVVLIMQAVDQRLGGVIELFKATEQNISYVFEGISSGLDVSCKNIAKGLKEKGILVSHPISGGRNVFAAAVLAGDQAKIDGHKKNVRQNSTTSKLATEGGLSTVLLLSPPLSLRFETEPKTGKITPVTVSDFTRTINILRDRPTGWNFHAVIAFAKDETEAAGFRKIIKKAVADKQYENIVFIDALSTPLGLEAFDQYVDFSAMALYYNGNNNMSSRENSDKARRVLDQDWKNRIYNGQFVVYTYAEQEGIKLGNAQGVASILQTIVTTRFPLVFDFERGLTENHMKLTQAKASAECGIRQSTRSVVKGIEKHVLSSVWNMEKYWENPTTSSFDITRIKIEVDKLVEASFNRDGQISIGEIYNFLEDTYGFAPCNLSAFITGFLLKEYGGEPYRYSDSSSGHEPMTPEKLAEMIGNYIGKTPKPTYIVKMTPDEMAFYELTEKAWSITSNSCSSAGQAANAVAEKMRGFGLPVWGLEEIDELGVFDVVQRYIDLVQKEGNEAHTKAVEIGKIAYSKPNLADNLFILLTSDNCQKGMREYLHSFEGGKIMELAKAIGAENNVIADIRKLFGVKHSCLWDKQTGEDEIRKLLTEYGIVKKSNAILNASAHSLLEAFKEWRERLRFLGISCEALHVKYPTLSKVFDTLLKIYQQSDVLPDQLKVFLSELTELSTEIKDLLNNDKRVFAEVYAPYLEDLSDNDISYVKGNSSVGLYELSKTSCNSKVKEAAEEYRKNQLKTQLFRIWRDKSGTKNPHEWSIHHRTPILCCVSEADFGTAKKAFETLNRNLGTDAEIRAALAFLEATSLFDVLSDEDKCNAAFKRDIIGEYHTMLPELGKVRDSLERLSIEGDTYGWYGNPTVKNKVKQLAEAEYNSGGSDRALHKIDEMEDLQQLKQYLKRLVKESMAVGIEILASGGGK